MTQLSKLQELRTYVEKFPVEADGNSLERLEVASKEIRKKTTLEEINRKFSTKSARG